MHVYQAMRTVAKRAGMALIDVGPNMEPPHGKAYVSAMISTGRTPRIDTLARMLSACGYQLCAVPRESVPRDAVPIDAE